MTTSVSSEARRNQTSILIRDRENHIPPKPDGQTDRKDRQTDIRTDGHTDGRTDIHTDQHTDGRTYGQTNIRTDGHYYLWSSFATKNISIFNLNKGLCASMSKKILIIR